MHPLSVTRLVRSFSHVLRVSNRKEIHMNNSNNFSSAKKSNNNTIDWLLVVIIFTCAEQNTALGVACHPSIYQCVSVCLGQKEIFTRRTEEMLRRCFCLLLPLPPPLPSSSSLVWCKCARPCIQVCAESINIYIWLYHAAVIEYICPNTCIAAHSHTVANIQTHECFIILIAIYCHLRSHCPAANFEWKSKFGFARSISHAAHNTFPLCGAHAVNFLAHSHISRCRVSRAAL